MKHNRTIAVIIGLLLLGGCGHSETLDPETLTVRGRLFVEQSPGESLTIADARLSALEKKALQQSVDVTITGSIDANGFDPFETHQSVFALTDASEEFLRVSKAHNHDDGDCPFCKNKSEPKQFMAVVRVVDESGTVFPRSAKKLLGLDSKQTVTVRGRASINVEDLLEIVPERVFVVK